jgi:cytochrome c oxidase subunit IV
MASHIVAKKLYFVIFSALIGLTALTTGVAYIDLGKWNTVAALAIACCKAILVALFFMHLRWSSGLLRLVLVASLAWFIILVGLTLNDTLTRNWTPVPSSWETSTQGTDQR